MWNRRYLRWPARDVQFSKVRTSEGPTEDDTNLRDINAAAFSEGEEAHDEQGVRKQVEM
jgi:hypothetical protein